MVDRHLSKSLQPWNLSFYSLTRYLPKTFSKVITWLKHWRCHQLWVAKRLHYITARKLRKFIWLYYLNFGTELLVQGPPRSTRYPNGPARTWWQTLQRNWCHLCVTNAAHYILLSSVSILFHYKQWHLIVTWHLMFDALQVRGASWKVVYWEVSAIILPQLFRRAGGNACSIIWSNGSVADPDLPSAPTYLVDISLITSSIKINRMLAFVGFSNSRGEVG